MKHTQVSIAELIKQKKGYQRLKINSMKSKKKGKEREKKVKRNEQSLQTIRDYVKRPNQCLISVPKEDRENEFKLEMLFRILSRRTSPT